MNGAVDRLCSRQPELDLARIWKMKAPLPIRGFTIRFITKLMIIIATCSRDWGPASTRHKRRPPPPQHRGACSSKCASARVTERPFLSRSRVKCGRKLDLEEEEEGDGGGGGKGILVRAVAPLLSVDYP